MKHLAALLLLFFSGSWIHAQSKNKNKGNQAKNWSYDRTGPAYWGDLDPNYSECGTGKTQSPIDLSNPTKSNLPTLAFEYKDVPLKMVNDGYNMHVEIAPGNFLDIEGEKFQLLQFHFHLPSEHTINGKHLPMEVHLVHKSDKDQFAVVGIMLEEGPPSTLIQRLWSHMPGHPKQIVSSPLTINAGDLLPKDRSYFRYDGSLTTPPCSEGLLWHVLRGTITIDNERMKFFTELFGEDTARPVQPLNNRKIKVSK